MAVIRRIANLFRRSRLNREIDAELQAHIDLRIDANIAAGMAPEEARRDALLRFGSPSVTRERVYSADALLGVESIWTDICHAWRQLLKSPGFSITAVLTLAIGIGANTAIFTNMDAVVLHPLAVPELNHVVTIAEQKAAGGDEQVALANYEDWNRQNRSFEELSVRTSDSRSMTGAGDAAQVQIALTSASFFSVLRVQAALGRVYIESECQPGRDAEAVLNYAFWKQHFGGDPSVLGRQIELDQRAFTVIGVLPKSVQYPPEADIFLPFAPTPQQLANRTAHDYMVTGRLRQGMTLKQAQAEMRAVADHLTKDYPSTNLGWSVKVEPLLDGINGDLTPLYYRLIMGATLFVLLVVCANIANLQFARGIERLPEIAMRTALGASRARIIRQLLTENILLALIGAAAGLVFAAVYLHLTLITMPERIARNMSGWSHISLNGRALAFSLLLAAAAGVVAGFAPALDMLRVNLLDQLKAGSRGTIGSGRSHRLRNVFAVLQISLAVALVIGAALMSKGMWSLLHLADVYQPKQMLTFDVSLPAARYDTPQKLAGWYADSLAKLRALPGVASAEVTSALPYSDNGWNRQVAIENRPVMPGKIQDALNLPVSAGYFDAMHIRLIAGRGFTHSDSLASLAVAVVSRRFASQYFPGENPLGHRIRMGRPDSHDPWLTIVGVAEETPYTLWDQTPYSVVYMSVAQVPPTDVTYAVVTNGDPLALADPARKTLAGLDPLLPVNLVETYAQLIHESLIGLIYAAVMLSIDALIALLLAAIGIFGVMANLVGERTREIGVRLAMGARREDVLVLILRRASWLTAAGIGSGLLLAFALAHLVANLLRGVRADDPAVFASITAVIAAIALASSWIPARRAAHVDPMQALRSE
jgi:putative ABC transport system permease protein